MLSILHNIVDLLSIFQVSLMMTIVGLAQNFVGSNNLNMLQPMGQFGTRLHGGKDSASPRYIFTMLRSASSLQTKKKFILEYGVFQFAYIFEFLRCRQTQFLRCLYCFCYCFWQLLFKYSFHLLQKEPACNKFNIPKKKTQRFSPPSRSFQPSDSPHLPKYGRQPSQVQH